MEVSCIGEGNQA